MLKDNIVLISKIDKLKNQLKQTQDEIDEVQDELNYINRYNNLISFKETYFGKYYVEFCRGLYCDKLKFYHINNWKPNEGLFCVLLTCLIEELNPIAIPISADKNYDFSYLLHHNDNIDLVETTKEEFDKRYDIFINYNTNDSN